MSEGNSLVRFEAAKQALIVARNIDEVKDVRDKAEALRLYMRQAGESLEMQNNMAEIKLRAERRAGEMLQEMANNGQRPLGRPEKESHDVTLSDLGIGKMQSARWQAEASLPEQVFEAHVAQVKERGGELTSAGVLKLAREVTRDAMPRPALPDGNYSVFLADPPWRYEHSISDSRQIENQYPTMALDEICALPIGPLAGEDSVLFLWATSPKLTEAMAVIAAWGFLYRTCAVWVKDRIGMGYYFRQQHELLLVAVKGNPSPPAPADRVPSIISAPRLDHSAKPEQLYEIIERMYPNSARIELFARKARPGWVSWGNEIVNA